MVMFREAVRFPAQPASDGSIPGGDTSDLGALLDNGEIYIVKLLHSGDTSVIQTLGLQSAANNLKVHDYIQG